jgi:hypothetical protein
MKHFLLLSAVFGLIGTICSANADPIISTSVTIWNAATPGATSTSASQQGLPTAVGLFGGPLPLVAGSTPFAFSINYNDSGLNTIPGFFASDTPAAPTPATCISAACLTNPLSLGGFAQATVFRFTFTLTAGSTFTAIHDDGTSLFVAGTETITCTIASCPGDLLPTSAAATSGTDSASIGPGTYDLWYVETNGIPAVLQATSDPIPTPEPASLTLLAPVLVGLGWFVWRRRKSTQKATPLNSGGVC